MEKTLEEKVRFDGKESRKDADQYIEQCEGGAVNLHIYTMGRYIGCNGCEYQKKCQHTAFIAGEQAEL